MTMLYPNLYYNKVCYMGNCYKVTILQRNYSWSFSYNSFVKFHGKIFGEPQYELLIYQKRCYNKGCYKETAFNRFSYFEALIEHVIRKFHRS